jgi:hypothetical protein
MHARAEEEKQRVGLTGAKTGILRSVAGAPLALVKGLARPASADGSREGTPRVGDASLANQWVDFLIQQADAADAVADAEAAEQNGHAGGATGEAQHAEAGRQ